ncbi:hypothetical protein [Methyloglobulus sp.]
MPELARQQGGPDGAPRNPGFRKAPHPYGLATSRAVAEFNAMNGS